MTGAAASDAPPRYLIDISAWIFGLRRGRVLHQAIRDRIDQLLEADLVASTGLVELELLAGAATEAEHDRLSQRLRGLHWGEVRAEDWGEAARLLFSLRRVGVTVPPTDGLLAALAMRTGLVLIHADRDFDAIAEHHPLRVESMVALVGG